MQLAAQFGRGANGIESYRFDRAIVAFCDY
jgi:hypothetical protein